MKFFLIFGTLGTNTPLYQKRVTGSVFWISDCFKLKRHPFRKEVKETSIGRASFMERRRRFITPAGLRVAKKWRSEAKGAIARVFSLWGNPLSRAEIWLNLGAGNENYENYTKVDQAGSQHLFDDITQLSRVPDDSVDRIYSNHVLEHIPVSLIGSMLKRWHAILKPGGSIRMRMPDAKQAVLHLHQSWQETTEARLAELQLPNVLERESVRSGFCDDTHCIQYVYGWSDTNTFGWDPVNQHKSLWTPVLARKRFEEAGFVVTLAENLGSLNTVLIAKKA